MPHNLRNVDSARAYPVSDALCHRLSRTRSGQGLPQKRRLRLKKLANLRCLTINVGTMTGKSREIADMMRRRNIGIACIQETRWKGSKARKIGDGYKMYYHGEKTSRNGIAITLEKKWQDNIIEIKRTSDRLMLMKFASEGCVWNIISAYAPQAGCTTAEKEEFYESLEQMVTSVPDKEEIVIGADLIVM